MPALEPAAVAQRPVSARLLRYLARDWGLLLLCALGYLLYSVGTVLLADLLQFLLDAVNDSAQVKSGIVSGLVHRFFAQPLQPSIELARFWIPVAVVVITAGRAVGYFAGNYCIQVVSRGLVHRLRCELFEALLGQPAIQLDSHSQGALVSKITYNVEQVAGAATEALKTLLRESLILVALLTYLAYLNWRLCLVFLAVMPVIVFVVGRVGRYFQVYGRRIQGSMGDVTQVASESMQAFRDIRMFGAQGRQLQRFGEASEANRVQGLKMALLESLSTPFLQVVISLAFAALIWFALSPAVLQGFSAGSLVAFLTAASQLGKPVRQLSAVQGVLQRGVVAAQETFFQIDLPRERDQGVIPADGVSGNLELQDVSFTYPGASRPALLGVSFTVEAGQTVAIAGRSGSGKTTLLHLLTRFYVPDSGRILLDGHAIEDYALESLRRKIAIVAQRTPLFRDTIAANVALGSRDPVSVRAIQEALEKAQASEFVARLPLAEQTVLGDAGAGLSGGEQQRIALARAILKDAPLLVLDEATSALDAESGFAVQQALEEVMRGRTSIVIAHRPATVESADRIVVLDGGRVAGVGRHHELLASCPLYARLHQQEFQA